MTNIFTYIIRYIILMLFLVVYANPAIAFDYSNSNRFVIDQYNMRVTNMNLTSYNLDNLFVILSNYNITLITYSGLGITTQHVNPIDWVSSRVLYDTPSMQYISNTSITLQIPK